jgi:hypothetical protein
MISYSTTEQISKEKWLVGGERYTVYEITIDLGASTGQTDLTGILKGWSILDWTSIEVDAGNCFIMRTTPTSDGATTWQVDLPGTVTQSYYWVKYIKETL